MSIEQVPAEQVNMSLTGLTNIDAKTEVEAPINHTTKMKPLAGAQASFAAEQAEKQLEKKQLEQAELAKQEQENAEGKEEVEQSLEVINELLPLKNTNLIFEFDDIAEPPIVKVVDKTTEEVIREIPPKNLRKITQALNDMADSISKTGALFNSEV